MFHKRCEERGDHNWTEWCWIATDEDGQEAKVLPDGTYTLPSGKAGFFFYKRICQNSGCDAIQRAEKLVPSGNSAIFDTKETDKAIASLKR